MNNLYQALPTELPGELAETLLRGGRFRLERIVSEGHCSPPGFWYDQPEHEWVIVLQGAARLRLEADDCTYEMKPGDCIHLPAHARHRVEWTTPDEPTIWLGLYYEEEASRQSR